VACPLCKRKYRIPAPAKVVVEPRPANLDDDLLKSAPADPRAAAIGIELEPSVVARPESPPAAVPVDGEGSVQLGYAADQEKRKAADGRLGDVVSGPKRGFWADAVLSFVYPVQDVSTAITCALILAFSSMVVLLRLAGIFGLIGIFLVDGWLASMFFSIIQNTAAGSDDMPNLTVKNGVMDDIIIPGIMFFGAVMVVLTPALILMVVRLGGLVPASWGLMGLLWLAAGIFILPISLLLFAFDAPRMIFRLDLMITTVFRTLLPYLAMWLILLVVAALYGVTALAPGLIEFNKPGSGGKAVETHLALGFLMRMLQTYATIVAMRVIGLYYLHFKKRFAFVLE